MKLHHRFVKVTADFFLSRERVAKVGEVLELPKALAFELVGSHKAEFVAEPVAESVAAVTEKPAKRA